LERKDRILALARQQRKEKTLEDGHGTDRHGSQSKSEISTRKFFAQLKSIEMEADHGDDADETIERQQHQAPASQAGWPPPIVLTSQLNLIQFQRHVEGLLKGNFDFRNNRNGSRVVMKDMSDFSAIRSHFESNNLPYFTFYPEYEKPIKAVLWHLPSTTPAEDMSDGLVNLGFDVISVKKYLPAVDHLHKENKSKDTPLSNNLT
jgi:hypothetical protein